MHPGTRGQADVLTALKLLHSWWRASVTDPADVFVARLVRELGLLPYAASGDLGTLRAGALLYALDAVSAAALAGDASLPGALAALGSALDLKEAEAPLEPGRADAIRLMNLHQAKGLESRVVVLADPTEKWVGRPELHLARSAEGVAEGFLRVTPASTGRRSSRDLARPMGWEHKEASEQLFSEAEEVRLLYVAVTRAQEELVVARWPDGRGTSAWAALEPWLGLHAEDLALQARAPAERDESAITPEQAASAISQASESLEAMSTPTYAHLSVTELAKEGESVPRTARTAAGSSDRGDFRGFSWGSTVHGALAVAAGNPSDEALRAACRDLLVEHERPHDDHGEPLELGELIGLVQSVRASELWMRAQAAERCLSEIAFAVPGVPSGAERPAPSAGSPKPTKEKRQLDLFVESAPRGSKPRDLERATTATESRRMDPLGDGTSSTDEEAHDAEGGHDIGFGPTVLEGVVDLAFQEADGWVIADYKTDVGTDPDFTARTESYRRQVDLYAAAWTRLTGEPVKERVLFYTAQGRVESW